MESCGLFAFENFSRLSHISSSVAAPFCPREKGFFSCTSFFFFFFFSFFLFQYDLTYTPPFPPFCWSRSGSLLTLTPNGRQATSNPPPRSYLTRDSCSDTPVLREFFPSLDFLPTRNYPGPQYGLITVLSGRWGLSPSSLFSWFSTVLPPPRSPTPRCYLQYFWATCSSALKLEKKISELGSPMIYRHFDLASLLRNEFFVSY